MTTSIQHIQNQEEFESLLKASNEKLVVIDFTAKWCGPCRFISPIFEKMAEDNPDVTFANVDVDEASDVSSACGINSMPTFQFYKGGSKIEVLQGANPDKLRATVEELRVPGVMKSRESLLIEFFDACLDGNMATVKALLEANPDFVAKPTPADWHAYHIMRSGWQPVVSTANPGVMNAKQTLFLQASHPAYALHLAAGNGHAELVKFLVEEAKADVQAGDGDGDTALTWAPWCARPNVIDLLIACGADSSFADTLTDAQFEAVKGDVESLQYLKNKRREIMTSNKK